jgi:hypothetical protein
MAVDWREEATSFIKSKYRLTAEDLAEIRWRNEIEDMAEGMQRAADLIMADALRGWAFNCDWKDTPEHKTIAIYGQFQTADPGDNRAYWKRAALILTED